MANKLTYDQAKKLTDELARKGEVSPRSRTIADADNRYVFASSEEVTVASATVMKKFKSTVRELANR